jgi:hypothetical protein
MAGRSGPRFRRAATLCFDALEPRVVPTASGSSYAALTAKHAYDQFVSELKGIELNSQATPAEFLALRDDIRAIGGEVSASGAAAHSPSTSTRLVDASLLVDRSLLDGWLGAEGWAEVRGKLAADLTPYHVEPALLDRTVADMQSAAASAAVDPGTYQVLASDVASVQSTRDWLHGGTPGASFQDPQVYYTEHLRGFFRGWGRQRLADAARLRADLAGAGPVVARDVSLLQQLGGVIPSAADQALSEAFVSATAGASDPSTFRAEAFAALGGMATTRRVSAVNRLSADAPAFAAAAGSPERVRTIVGDVRTVNDDGQGAPLNPFRIVAVSGPAPAG